MKDERVKGYKSLTQFLVVLVSLVLLDSGQGLQGIQESESGGMYPLSAERRPHASRHSGSACLISADDCRRSATTAEGWRS